MAKIVNLRTYKRQIARDEARRIGAVNAAKFGQSRAEAEVNQKLSEISDARHASHKREDTPKPDDQTP